MENRLRSLKSLQANFEQFFYSTSVSSPLEEKGKLFMKKPDLMKWKYEDPEEKIFLYKNRILLSYFPEDNQLIRNRLTKKEGESEILALLSGRKGLLDNYSVEFSPFPTEKTNALHLKLTPKIEQDYSLILLEINEKTWLIQKAIFFDWAGNKQEFHFKRIKINSYLAENIFEIKIPPGVEIIEN